MPEISKRGPSAWSFIGDMKQPYPYYFHELMKRFGDVVNCGNNIFLVSHPDYARHILNQDIKKYEKQDLVSRRMRVLFGKGSLCCEGEEWVNRRRILNPFFTGEGVKKTLPRVRETIDSFLDNRMDPIQPGIPFNLVPLIGELALAIAAKAFLNADLDGDARRVAQLVTAGEKYITSRNPLFIPFWVPTPGHTRLRHSMRELNEVLHRVTPNAENINGSNDSITNCLNNMVVGPRKQQIITDEMRTLLISGSSTIAAALSNCWYFLSLFPAQLEKMRKEVTQRKTEFSEKEDDASLYPFTRQCILESLRLLPAAYLIWRRCTRKDEFDGYSIPEGATVIISLFNIHRHPGTWEQPDKFDPSRFEKEKVLARPQHHFMPFGWGPRKCPGDIFSMEVLPLIMARMLQQYSWELPVPEELKLKQAPAMMPEKIIASLRPAEKREK